MKSKITIIVALAAMVVLAAGTVWAEDLYVEPEDTIQGVIDVAQSGDVIHVAAGIYEEEIKIMDKSLTLLGAQADVPIVNGERTGDESIIRGKGTGFPPYAPSSWCVIRIKHSDVVVNGFTIENGKRGIAIQGIGPDGISNIRVSYNYIEGSGYVGIFRDNAAADVAITNNYIASNPRGIATNGGATTITDNTFYGNGKGIDFNGGDPYGVYFPDYAEPNYPTIISGNTFTNDSTSITLALDECHQSITITGNDITEARSAAIKTWNTYDVDIVNPAIHCNSIWNNVFGINNQVTEINLDATNNWWGDASGPTHGDNPGGTGDAVSDDVDYDPWTPGYHSSGFEPPMDKGAVKVKKNRVLPLKAELLDVDGNPVTDADITAPPVIQVIFIPTVGDAEDVTDEALSAGQGDNGNQFVYTGSQWQLNLKTKNYSASGMYTITMVSGDGCEYVIDPVFTAQFVIE